MNVINPFMFSPPILYPDVFRFACPNDFSFKVNDTDIVDMYAKYNNLNKKYICLISDSAAYTEIGSYSGRTYAYSENGGNYNVTSNGSPIPWTAGSSKRHIIVIDTNSSISARIPANTIWCFMGSGCYTLVSNGPDTLQYLHLESPETFTSLPDNCLNGSGLTGELSIPVGVTYIGQNALSYCMNLTGKLTIPDSVVTLGDYCFQRNWNMIGGITFPDSITTIGRACFYDCHGFDGAIKFPANLISIGVDAFYNCVKLSGGITLPNSLVSIGVEAFNSCSGISGTLTIPTIMTAITEDCFGGTGFSKIAIPNNITTIGNHSFNGMQSLINVSIHKVTPIVIPSGVFAYMDLSKVTLHVPVGSLAAYRAAAYWSDFATIIDDL